MVGRKNHSTDFQYYYNTEQATEMTTQQVNMDHMLRDLNELKYIRTGSYTQGNEPWGPTQQVNMDHMVTELQSSTSGQAQALGFHNTGVFLTN